MKIGLWILNAILFYFILIDKPLCQDITKEQYQYNIGISPLRGFLLPHNSEVKHLTYGRPTGAEVNFNIFSLGDEAWQHRYNMPESGVSLTYFDTDMEETGILISAMAYMKFHIFSTGVGTVVFQPGLGLTYSNTTYDRNTNNLNNVISSALTYNMQGRIGFQFDWGGRWLIYPSFTLTHASNGSFKLPNAGINIVSANLGVGYKIAATSRQQLPDEEEPLKTNIGLNILLSGTANEIYPAGGSKYPYLTLRTYADKTLNRYSRIVAGFDFFNNRALKEVIDRNEGPENEIDHKRIGLIAGHELTVSNVSVMIQLGYYLYRPYKQDFDPMFYQRYGVKYYLNHKFFMTSMLKTFAGRADTFDFGFGVRL